MLCLLSPCTHMENTTKHQFCGWSTTLSNPASDLWLVVSDNMQRIFSQCTSQISNHSPVASCSFVLTHRSCVTARNSLACCDLCPVMCWFSHHKECPLLLWQRWQREKQEAIQLPACSFITLMWLRQGFWQHPEFVASYFGLPTFCYWLASRCFGCSASLSIGKVIQSDCTNCET